MRAPLSLAWRTLVRRPRRLALFVAGVTVAAAITLDMIMLSAGLERSLASLLEETGYQVRATPRGLLPFESRAGIPRAEQLIDSLKRDPRVVEVAPVWGQTVYLEPVVAAARRPTAAFAVAVPSGTTPTLRIRTGRAAAAAAEIVVNPYVASELGLTPGDSVVVGTDPSPALGTAARRRVFRVTGTANFIFAPGEHGNVAVTLEGLWDLADAPSGTAALLLVRTADDADAYAVARDFRRTTRTADIYAIPEIIEAAGDRLTYFEQLSLVLGTVSLGVAFVLVATLLTLSVNERWGEIATLRAVGVTRARMLEQVAWQGLLISVLGSLTGSIAGIALAEYLDTILRDFPGLPADVSFFVLLPQDALTAVALLVGTGLAAGLYPAWRAASVNISASLREEIT